jgi:hypothetical protein
LILRLIQAILKLLIKNLTMKIKFIAACIYALVAAGCGSSNDPSNEHDEGPHMHENGTEHEHEGVKQEEFTAGTDTIADTTKSHIHDESNDHDHNH